jgi:hypothetical protein
MVGRGTHIGTNCMVNHGVRVVGERSVGRKPNGWLYAFNDGPDVTRGLKGCGLTQTLQRSENRAAARVTQDDDKAGVKPGSRELDAADLRRCDDIAGYANDEEVAEPLIENKLGWDPRVGASEDDCEWLLRRREFGTTGVAEAVEGSRLARGEPAVAVAESG